MPHAMNRFIRDQMDARRIEQAELVKRSGLSRSHVSKLLNDDRDRLPQLPARTTIDALAEGLRVPASVVLGKAIEALGIGFKADDFVVELQSVTDDELLQELANRLWFYAAEAKMLRAGRVRAPGVDPDASERLRDSLMARLESGEDPRYVVADAVLENADGNLLAAHRGEVEDYVRQFRRRDDDLATDVDDVALIREPQPRPADDPRG